MTDPRLETLSAADLNRFTAREGLALVELGASWSGPSYLVRSVVERLLRRRPDLELRVGRVDVSEAPDLLVDLGLAGPPALLLFLDGEVVALHSGLITSDALEKWLTGAGSPERTTTREE